MPLAQPQRDRTYDDHVTLDAIGTVQRIFRSPKATRIALKSETSPRMSFVDIICFHQVPRIEKGDRVLIKGRISSEKSGVKETGKNGKEYDKWIPLLIGESVELLGEAQARIPGTGNRYQPANDNNGDDDIPF